MNAPPAATKPAFKAITQLAYDVKNTTSRKKQREDVVILQKRIAALEKKNKRWAMILTLVVTGSLPAAMHLAKVSGVTIPQSIISAAKPVGDLISATGSGVGRALKESGKAIVDIVARQFYTSLLLAPFTIAHHFYTRPPPTKSTKKNGATSRS